MILSVIVTVLAVLSGVPENVQVTARLESQLSNSAAGEHHLVWVQIDPQAVEFELPELTDKALRRRAKADPRGFLIDNHDYRIPQWVVDSLASTGAEIRQVSHWLKEISVSATSEQLTEIARTGLASRMDQVQTLTAIREPDTRDRYDSRRESQADEDYGISVNQITLSGILSMHAAGYTGQGVTVALIDAGYDHSTRFFDSTNVVGTWDFIHNDTVVSEVECPGNSLHDQQPWHGTAVLGVMAAYLEDTLIGGAYGADYLLAKTEITCDGTEIKVEEDNWVAAAEWAELNGADIITSSLGYTTFQDSGSYTLNDLDGNTARITFAADLAASKNVLVITSAGNLRSGTWGRISFPADGDSVLSVGAVNLDSSLAAFSSPGPTADGRIKPEIVTLGTSVVSTNYTGTLSYVSGTSFAAPIVASGAALALEADPTMTAYELFEQIREAGDRFTNPDNDFGHGLYDATRSSGLLQIVAPEAVNVVVGERQDIVISAESRLLTTPSFSLITTLGGVTLEDNMNGSATLYVQGVQDNVGTRELLVEATNDVIADTVSILIATGATGSPEVRIGPNPFTDSLVVRADGLGNGLKSVSIFTIAGERVWEALNISSLPTDNVIWYGHNSAGEKVASGVYLIMVETEQGTVRRKLLKLN